MNSPAKSTRFVGIPVRILAGVALVSMPLGCATTRSAQMPAADFVKPMEVTAYCPCKKCCGWHRNWRGKAVTTAGYPKKVGVTASGVKARAGTIAADTSKYPFGTQMYVPGYGYGTVQDRGGAIKGDHIDVFFKSHKEALNWGRVQREVYVWLVGTETAMRR
ncbi:MAG: 3D domain-containing protein [Candidatus Hydrogenedentes bacterium]|nr:3D domain-containing protein [Candidatus Hydrogenedentota bacterium]